MSTRSINVGSRPSRPVIVVIALATACLLIFAVTAVLLLGAKPTDPPLRWTPPIGEPLPAAIAGRDPLPFCGVAEGGDEEFVYLCMQQAIDAQAAAEAGIVGVSDLGERVQILRFLRDGSVELFVFGDHKTEGHDGWLLVRCDGLKTVLEPRFVVSPDGCGPARPA